MNLLTASAVSHAYSRHSLFRKQTQHPVLNAIDLSIKVGESVALVGRSGCGKSTLARMLYGLEMPQQGHVLFQNCSTKQMDREQQREMNRQIQMVFQDSLSAVDPRKNVEAIISEPLRYLTDLNKEQQSERIIELLNRVELGEKYRFKKPSQISGGQLQRVCIARALAVHPKLVILDEALSSLDLLLQIQMLAMLKKIQGQTQTAWLLVTHDLRLAKQFCQRMLVMDDGAIVETCRINESPTFTHPATMQLQDAILSPLPKQLEGENNATNYHYHR